MKKQVKINIPESWAEVTLEQYQNYVISTDTKDEAAVMFNTIASLCSVPREYVERFKIEDLKKVYTNLNKLIEKPLNKELVNIIEIDGVRYGMHPNLDSMSFGEYVDLEEFAKAGLIGFHKVLAILYRPIADEQGARYNIEPYEVEHQRNAEKFKGVNMDVINGVSVFFYTLGGKFLQIFQASTGAEIMTETAAK